MAAIVDDGRLQHTSRTPRRITLIESARGDSPAPPHEGNKGRMIGVLAGVVVAGATVVRAYDAEFLTDAAVALSLDALRSPRHLWSRIVFNFSDGLQFALGAFFSLLRLRLIVRKTWIAALVLVVLNLPVAEGSGTIVGLVYVVGATVVFFATVLRFGFLAGVTMLIVYRLLTRIP